MNSRGFTLVELLLSIIILALIISIAVPGVNGISKAIRENQRKNIIERIEIAASKYAYDTGETIIFVDKLITEGYIESDDEDNNIKDPLNNTRMNCYIVEMEKKENYYNAKFIDDKDYDNNGDCDLSKLNKDESNVKIEVINNGLVVNDPSNWLKGKVTLKAYSDDCKVNKCVWSSSSGANVIGEDSIDIDNVSNILETKYTFQITIYDEEKEEIKRYKGSVDLKIDNAAPIIYENEISVTDKFIYTNTKKVVINASDGKGSGIIGYYLALNNNQSCNNSNISFQESNVFNVDTNGSYLICVKDKVGNISSYNGLNISYIKKTLDVNN